MSKAKSTRSQKKSQNRFYGLLVIAALILGGVLVLVSSRGNGSTAIAQITPNQYQQQFSIAAADHLLLDVRTPEEFASGHIPGAVNIPVEALANRLSEVPQTQTVVVYCRSGNRSATASQILAEAGYSSIYDLGGINAWAAQGLPVE